MREQNRCTLAYSESLDLCRQILCEIEAEEDHNLRRDSSEDISSTNSNSQVGICCAHFLSENIEQFLAQVAKLSNILSTDVSPNLCLQRNLHLNGRT